MGAQIREEAARLWELLGRLRCLLVAVEAAPEGSPLRMTSGRAGRVGFLAHSLVGKGLREVGCRRQPICAEACADPAACPYGRLLEARPQDGQAPLGGQRRIPNALVVQAPWSRWRPGDRLAFKLVLLGDGMSFEGALVEGLRRALALGVGPPRQPMRLVGIASEAREVGAWVRSRLHARAAAEVVDLSLELRSPLRLVRRARELRAFVLEEVVRDLSLRLAAWGHYHQGLPWTPAQPALFATAARLTVEPAPVRWVRFRRYSGRQGREIPLGGVIGRVRVRDVPVPLAALLLAGECCGSGKGTSIGLGHYGISVLPGTGETSLSGGG